MQRTRQLTTGLLRAELALDEWELYSDGYKVSKKKGFTIMASSLSCWEYISDPGPYVLRAPRTKVTVTPWSGTLPPPRPFRSGSPRPGGWEGEGDALRSTALILSLRGQWAGKGVLYLYSLHTWSHDFRQVLPHSLGESHNWLAHGSQPTEQLQVR